VLTVVLDTQIILRGASSATSSITARIYAAWNAGRFTLLISEPILDEVEDVLLRPEVLRKLHMTRVEAAALTELLRRQSLRVTPTVRIARSRDPADDKFLECAAAGAADYLVSADADLLSLTEINGIPIVEPPALLLRARRTLHPSYLGLACRSRGRPVCSRDSHQFSCGWPFDRPETVGLSGPFLRYPALCSISRETAA
jgi:putative PIN family toxin of toxin-antitoxin system